MKSVLDVEVSCFSSYLSKEPQSVNLLTWLLSNKYARQVQELRAIDDKAKRDAIKAKLPAITVSGVFHPIRLQENLVKHSKLICIDIDPKENLHIANYQELKKELFKIRNIAYAGLSVSGKGFFLIIPITRPKLHKQHFQALYNDFLSMGITIDVAPQNVASLRGYSYDPEALFRHNALPYRKIYKPEIKQSQPTKISFTPNPHIFGTREKTESLIKSLIDTHTDITQAEPTWFKLACSFANEFGESGRGYFHAVSQLYPSYDRQEADKKFNHALMGRYTSITIATFFKLAKDALLK